MLRRIRIGLSVLLMAVVMLSCVGSVCASEEETEALEERETQGQVMTEREEDGKKSAAGRRQSRNEAGRRETLEQKLLEPVREILPVLLGMTGKDPQSSREWIIEQVKKIVKNPDQYSEDFWDSLFGTGADGISVNSEEEEEGTVHFVMDLPDPVRMPGAYSVEYQRQDHRKGEVMTLLERDADGNIHYLDGKEEMVFVRTDEGFCMYPVLEGGGFGTWDGVLLSARSVRDRTSPFWDCADQTFIRWLGADLMEETEYLGRPCGLYHAEPGTITFTYQCDMVIDDETGICLCYTADELLKGAVYNITDDNTIEISIGDYDIGGDEMNFYCTAFKTDHVSFEIPEG